MKKPTRTTRRTAWIQAFEIRKLRRPELSTAAGKSSSAARPRPRALRSCPQPFRGAGRRSPRGQRLPSSAMATCSVLIVDRYALVRRALRALLRSDGDLDVVGEAADVGHALADLRAHR